MHVVDGSADDPIGDFITINEELEKHDPFLAQKPQVVVLNKVDISEVKEMEDDIMSELKRKAGHSRVLSISAATTENVKELMGRLKKFVSAQPESDLPPIIEVDLGKAALDQDSDDFGTLQQPWMLKKWAFSVRCLSFIFQSVFALPNPTLFPSFILRALKKFKAILRILVNGESRVITSYR